MHKHLLMGLLLVWVVVVVVLIEWPSDEVEIVFCDVGQGDGVLIQEGFNQVVIDGGNENGLMVECLGRYMPFWDRHINLMVMTHPQSDHFGGLGEVAERYAIEVFAGPNAVNQTDAFWDFYQQIVTTADRIVTAESGQRLVVGGLTFDVLWPHDAYGLASLYEVDGADDQELMSLAAELEDRQPVDVNDASVVLWMRHGDVEGLFVGDLGMDAEAELLSMYDFSGVDVLKVGHHGSRSGTSASFAAAMMGMEYAVISASENNSYGHPHAEVVERLEETGANVLVTAESGDIFLVSNQMLLEME